MSEKKIDAMFQKVEQNESFKKMFFEKLSTTTNPYPWFKRLAKKGYLNPKGNNKNPIVNGDSYTVLQWYAVDYLDNVASNLSKKPNPSILDQLVKVIYSIISFKENDGKRIENPYTDYKILKIIFMLPIDRITENHVNFLQTVLTSKFRNIFFLFSTIDKAIPYLVEHKAKDLLLKTLRVLLDYNKEENEETFSRLDFTSVLDDYWLSKVIHENGDQIIEICGISLAELIVDVMKTVLEKNVDAFNCAIICTIEESAQNFVKDRYQLQLVYFLRKTLEHLNPPIQKVMLRDFLKGGNNPIFKRLAFYIINYFYDEYNSLFWQWPDNHLEFELKHESYELIKKNGTKLTKAQIGKFLSWVSSIEFTGTEDAPKGSQRYSEIVANARLEWLSALDGIVNKKVSALKQEYSKVYTGKIVHPGYNFWMETYTGISGDPDVFTSEVISGSNANLVQHILKYKPKYPYDRHDLPLSFQRVVRDNPEKFASDITPFLNIDFDIQAALIDGFTDAWKEGKQFSVEPVLEFLNNILTQASANNKNWNQSFAIKSIAEIIAEFIDAGTSDDKRCFDDEFLPLCESMLLQVIITADAKIAYNHTEDMTVNNDLLHVMTAVLNLPLSEVYKAVISYSLRVAKVNNKDKEEKWVKSIKDYYQKAITDSNRTVEFEVNLGQFLSDLYYLDKAWIIENINELFPKEDEVMWRYGFMSYLFYSTRFSSELYCLLKENGHYKKALVSMEEGIFEKLPQHICIAYLNDIEPLKKGSLVDGLIAGDNVSYLFDFVDFFGHQHGHLDENMKKKVKPVWSAIINHIESVPEKEDQYKKVLTYLYYWLDLVDNIDEDIVKLITLSNKYIADFDLRFFIKYLNRHVENNPEQVADIFCDFLSNNNYNLSIQKEEIISLVETLFKKGEKEKAVRICNIHLDKRGFKFLMPIYAKYIAD